MKRIAPSILSANFGHLWDDVHRVAESGADLIHIDVMDGCFVPNITFGPQIIKDIRSATDLIFDVHLMIDSPEKYIKDFCEAGSDIVTVHVEATKHIHRTVQLIKSYGKKAGVALNPGTPVTALGPVLADIDYALFMTVNPGFGGQAFIPSASRKIREFSWNLYREIGPMVSVDGGINAETISIAAKDGATIFVAGSAVFNTTGSLKDNIDKLKSKW
jgi:ribulose-phosphate 3-epimerase